MTKQELEQTNIELQKENKRLESHLEEAHDIVKEARMDFARIFEWYTVNHRLGFEDDRKYYEPTWAEIYAEVGRLQKAERMSSERERIDTMQQEINELRYKVENNENNL